MEMDTKAAEANKRRKDSIDQELYAKREKIYPREVHGLFANLRVLGVLILLGTYYGLPWVRWEGRQAVLLDLPARQFHIFGITFWPQDFFYLAMLLIIAALSLFFFTALAGRLWCGYACPQTVWTEAFLWIERKLEGDRLKQMKLDKAPWTGRKILIKGGKQALWILFSLYTGYTFVGYFTPIQALTTNLLVFNLGPWETFWILFYGFATYGNAGWMREQVCIYMCPYARFQSAMFDKDTLIISYDQARGEPRGARRRGTDHRALGKGDCIDCSLCVQVCPTGIDIRNGLQYQCIGCAACIDVCDQIMDKMQYPKGLIRYTTEHTMHGKNTRILRPRVMVYATLLLGITAVLVLAIIQRVPLELDVIRDRNALYRETNEGLIENIYTLKVINKDRHEHRYRLGISGLEGIELFNEMGIVSVPSEEVLNVPVRARIDPAQLEKRSSTITFWIWALDDDSIQQAESARFLGPLVR
jgi:cytochrome c oxidase accessory protein FixG